MCEVEFEGIEERALLIRQEGKLHALSNKCTHYGAPLVKGLSGKWSNSLPLAWSLF